MYALHDINVSISLCFTISNQGRGEGGRGGAGAITSANDRVTIFFGLGGGVQHCFYHHKSIFKYRLFCSFELSVFCALLLNANTLISFDVLPVVLVLVALVARAE